MNKRTKTIIPIIIILVLILIIAGIYIYFTPTITNNTNFENSFHPQEIDTPHGRISTDVKTQIKIYTIMFATLHDSQKEYKLDNDFYIKSNDVITDGVPVLTLTINNGNTPYTEKLIHDDYEGKDVLNNKDFTFNFYRIGDYLAFKKHDYSTDRDKHLFLYDKSGNLYKDFHELDLSSPGMVMQSIKFQGHSIIVKGSRINQDNSIAYKNNSENIPANTPVEATYYYQMVDGNMDFDNPKIQVTKTYKDFIESLK